MKRSTEQDTSEVRILEYSGVLQGIVRKDIGKAIVETLKLRICCKEHNEMFIMPIPKKEAPMLVFDFLLISLFNVLYEIIVKMLTNRLKLILLS